jgi:hypothetical protein
VILEEGMPAKPKDARHALFIGATIGSMLRFGIDCRPVVDADGDYTDGIELLLPNLQGATVTVIVPEPSDDWDLTDEIERLDTPTG